MISGRLPMTPLKIGAGDCDDKAILISSMLEAVGGKTRVYLTDTHAFAAVYWRGQEPEQLKPQLKESKPTTEMWM